MYRSIVYKGNFYKTVKKKVVIFPGVCYNHKMTAAMSGFTRINMMQNINFKAYDFKEDIPE